MGLHNLPKEKTLPQLSNYVKAAIANFKLSEGSLWNVFVNKDGHVFTNEPMYDVTLRRWQEVYMSTWHDTNPEGWKNFTRDMVELV